MKNPTNLIYLFFIKNKLPNSEKIPKPYLVETYSFMFQCFLMNKKTSFTWNRMFRIYKDYAVDDEYGIVTANLEFHHFIDKNHKITNQGILFLEEQLNDNKEFSILINDFYKENKYEHFLKGTFLENYFFSSEDDNIPISISHLYHH